MDLSRVTSIGIPEGNVVKIEHGGIVLWQQDTEATTFDGYGVVEFSGRGSKVLKSATFYGASVKDGDVIKSNNSQWRATSGSIVDLSAIILRSVDNVIDEFESISGKLTRRVVSITLTGSESGLGRESGTYPYFYIRLGNINSVAANVGLCSHMDRVTINGSTNNKGFNIINSSGYNEARLVWRMPTNLSLAQMREQLAAWRAAGTPMTVNYQPTSASVSYVTPQPIRQVSGYNAIRQTSGDLLGSHLTVEAFGTAVASYTVEIGGDAVLSHLGEDAVINKIGFLDPAGSLVKMIDLRPGGDDFDDDPTIPYQMIDGVGSIYLYALEDTQDVTVTLQLSGGDDIIKTLPSRDQSTDLTFPISSDLDITGVRFTT